MQMELGVSPDPEETREAGGRGAALGEKRDPVGGKGEIYLSVASTPNRCLGGGRTGHIGSSAIGKSPDAREDLGNAVFPERNMGFQIFNLKDSHMKGEPRYGYRIHFT